MQIFRVFGFEYTNFWVPNPRTKPKTQFSLGTNVWAQIRLRVKTFEPNCVQLNLTARHRKRHPPCHLLNQLVELLEAPVKQRALLVVGVEPQALAHVAEGVVGLAERVVEVGEAAEGGRVVGDELGEGADVEEGLARVAGAQQAVGAQLVRLRRPGAGVEDGVEERDRLRVVVGGEQLRGRGLLVERAEELDQAEVGL